MILCALSVGEKFSVGGITALLGLGMTFVVLGLLIGFIYLVNYVNKIFPKKLSLKKRERKEPIVEETPKKDDSIDDATMVAIRSAVEIYVKENSSDGKAHDNMEILSVKEI